MVKKVTIIVKPMNNGLHVAQISSNQNGMAYGAGMWQYQKRTPFWMYQSCSCHYQILKAYAISVRDHLYVT